MKEENIRTRDHSPEELSHYSKATTDFEYLFPFGWGELWGVANRTDFDLKQHSEHSGENFSYIDPVTNERYIPYCVEPSVGIDRVALAFLCDAYHEEDLENGDTRVVLKLHPYLAPYKAAVLPYLKSLARKLKKFTLNYVRSSLWTMMNLVVSVEGTVVRMKLVHLTVLLLILILLKITVLP